MNFPHIYNTNAEVFSLKY